MWEANTAVLVDDNFKPLEVLNQHSKIWKIGTGFKPLIQDYSENDGQSQTEFKCHNVFLFHNGFCTWVYAIVEQRVSDAMEADPITAKSLFTASLTVKVEEKDKQFKSTRAYKDITVVDVVECRLKNGTRAFVGALCLLIEFKWHKAQYINPRSGKWFENPPENIKAALTVERASEFNRNNMPFRYSDAGTGEDYLVASEYAIRRSARDNGLFRVKLVERSSPDLTKSLILFSDIYMLKRQNDQVSIRITVMSKDRKWPMTTNTPFTMELQIKKGSEEEKWKAKPYHGEITAFKPWAVDMVSGCSLALLGVSLPIRDTYEAQFFEEAFEDMASVEVKYTLTRQSLE
jgi:hypothetical protein